MNKTGRIKSRLLIRGVELCVFLGWPEEERVEGQVVLLDMEIILPTPPSACLTDELQDTFCYADIIAALHEKLQRRVFKLIEHLCYEIYQLVKPSLPVEAKLSVQLTKHPKIQGLTGGVSFSYEDEK